MSLLDRVEALRSKPTLNRSPFDAFVKDHRPHQLQALEEIHKSIRKQIIVPTGTGKTRIQVHTHVEDMLDKSKHNQTGVYVIAAHRLLLCHQLMDDLKDLAFKCGLQFNILYVGSARYDDKDVYDRYFKEGVDSSNFRSTYTTNGEEVKSFYEETKAANRHLLIVSTYHSFDKLKVITPIDLCTYDEAHTTTGEDFSKNIEVVEPNIHRNYFFTATRKVSGDHGGMNDEAKYGSVFGVLPSEMILRGEILMPRIHIMHLEDGGTVEESNEKMLVKTIMEGFKDHKDKLKKESAFPELIGAKLLVSTKGSDEIDIIHKSQEFKDWCAENNIKTFFFSSKYGYYQSFEERNKLDVYESIKALKDTEDCILLHIDMLTEGIDLPAITAVMLLRHLNVIKLLQTLGRAVRLLRADRVKLYKGEIAPNEKDKYIKPYAYVMLPMHFESFGDDTSMTDMLKAVISEYNLPTEEFLPVEEFEAMGSENLDPVTKLRQEKKKEREYPLLHVIEDFILKKFEESLPTDPTERYNKILELFESHKETHA